MREFLKPRMYGLGLYVLALAVAAAASSWSATGRQRVFDLPLPRAASSGEELAARVSVGPLKAHQRIIVRIRNGEIAGAVSPFGAQARQSPGVYTIPLPATAVKDGEVRLLVEVEEPGAETRAPTAEEVVGIKLTYISVTKSSGKE